MRKFNNVELKNYKNEVITTRVDGAMLNCRLEHALWLIYNSFSALPYNIRPKTVNDNIQAVRFLQAMEKQVGAEVLEFEDGVHDWVVSIAPLVIYEIFFPNGEIVHKLIKDGYVKE